jgi:hypothetical protein
LNCPLLNATRHLRSLLLKALRLIRQLGISSTSFPNVETLTVKAVWDHIAKAEAEEQAKKEEPEQGAKAEAERQRRKSSIGGAKGKADSSWLNKKDKLIDDDVVPVDLWAL